MYSKTTTVINATGLHARPAGLFSKAAKAFTAEVTIRNLAKPELKPAKAKNVISVMALAMSKGTEVEISAEGPDEVEAVDSLVALIESGFGET